MATIPLRSIDYNIPLQPSTECCVCKTVCTKPIISMNCSVYCSVRCFKGAKDFQKKGWLSKIKVDFDPSSPQTVQ